MSGVTLDAGPMIQLDRDERRVVALLALADETGIPVVIPGAALAQAIRQPARQPRLARLLRQPRTEVVALNVPTLPTSAACSSRAAQPTSPTPTSFSGARRSGATIVTSDPDDLHVLDPTATPITI